MGDGYANTLLPCKTSQYPRVLSFSAGILCNLFSSKIKVDKQGGERRRDIRKKEGQRWKGRYRECFGDDKGPASKGNSPNSGQEPTPRKVRTVSSSLMYIKLLTPDPNNGDERYIKPNCYQVVINAKKGEGRARTYQVFSTVRQSPMLT